MAAPKMTKNQMRRAKKKEQKKARAEQNGATEREVKDETAGATEPAVNGDSTSPDHLEVKKDPDASDKIDADGPVDEIVLPEDDPAFAAYKSIFKKFGAGLEDEEASREANAGNKGEVFFDQDDEIPSEGEDAQPKLSKKKRKKLNKLSIAELKALVRNPEVVEWHDVSSSDPRLLVQIKAQRNIVPVPGHWSLKREYLSSKRGIEKPPFKLPKFIAETGITEMRDAVLEKQAEQTLKQKQRERVQPKMGKLDIDYQKLYDAFFRHQTKPELTRFGDVYYEGKEWEADYKVFKPGEISDALREALGMQPGASWGFQPGQWGKPPLDEYNRPLYGGDIFGIMAPGQPGAAGPYQPQQGPQPQAVVGAAAPVGEPVERTLWGELQPLAEESEEEESEEEEEEEGSEAGDIPPGGTETVSGLETPGGYASTVHADMHAPAGVETSMAGEFDLRKTRRGFETEESSYGAPRQAYTVIPERQGRAEGFFGSDKTYDLSKKQAAPAPASVPVLGQDDEASRKRKKPGDVDVALDPDALAASGGISKDDLRRKFEAGRREEGVGAQWSRAAYEEDLSDMIAQESRKRQRREEERRGERGGGNAGYLVV
ncbi:19efbf10-a6cb-4dd7-86c9-e1091edab9ed [Thermothielavioides terrestris]|uniref:19efbf10-a6cb-4dd7-86c9-e1091edab9ed n=1 Tax=Thermothielavioides terrestris TaxID=2587410 RepID=A0A446BY73_9PEZI|nr:19efbf10-a6cb-4dd7-86c9-e1091edab9ed [Thermothielavioides terrestris]